MPRLGDAPAAADAVEPPGGEGLGGAVERHIRGYFAAHKGGLPAAGLYDRILREVERPLIVLTLGATRGNQIKAAHLLGPQPQHLAQEDPRVGHSGRARTKITPLRPRFVGRSAFGPGGLPGPAEAAGPPLERLAAISGSRFCMKLMRRGRRWAGRIGLRHTLAFGLSTAALGSGVATYLALTGALPFGPHPNAVLSLLNLDLVLLLALGALIAKRLLQVWAERRRGLAGSRLQIRLVVLFSLIAVTPTIIVAVFSYLFFSYGVESWFSDKVRTAISESVVVAEAYLHEHQQAIRADALAMANDLNRNAAELELDPRRLEQVVSAQAALRGLTEAMVFDSAGHVLARSSLSFALGFEPVPSAAIRVADEGDVAIMTNDSDNRVRALVRLDGFGHVYLYVGRYIEARVLNHIEETQRAAAQYQKMESQRSGFPGHVRADFSDGGDAVSGRRGGDRNPFRHPARGPDQPPRGRRRTGARRRSRSTGARRREG